MDSRGSITLLEGESRDVLRPKKRRALRSLFDLTFSAHTKAAMLSFIARIRSIPTYSLKGCLVDPQMRASNEVIDDPSKLACSLFRDGG
jgi:hypothetical protein